MYFITYNLHAMSFATNSSENIIITVNKQHIDVLYRINLRIKREMVHTIQISVFPPVAEDEVAVLTFTRIVVSPQGRITTCQDYSQVHHMPHTGKLLIKPEEHKFR